MKHVEYQIHRDRRDCRMVVARGWGSKGWGVIHGWVVSVWEGEKVVKMDDECCTTFLVTLS